MDAFRPWLPAPPRCFPSRYRISAAKWRRCRKFNLTLSASATLRETESGRLLWDRRTFTVTREAFTDGGQLQSEYQTLPLLAEALAQRVALAALDSW